MKFRKGMKVSLETHGAGFITTEDATVLHIRKGEVWLDNGPGNDPTGPFDQEGRYLGYTVAGFTFRLAEPGGDQ